MIITLTMNPSVDRTAALSAPLAVGGVNRIAEVDDSPGGKGVNVARVLAAGGIEARAVFPAPAQDPFVAMCTDAGIPATVVSADGAVRVNLTVADPDGTTTKINAPGAPLLPEHVDAVVELLVQRGADASWAVLAGSLPPGAPEDVYARIVRRVRSALGERAPRFAVDTSGAALRGATADDGALPDLIKPNGEELAELVGTLDGERLEADPDLAAATAAALVGRGLGAVLTTLGAGGAVLTVPEGSWHAVHEPVAVRSTVGAGDSSLSGYLIAQERGDAPPECLRQAVASGSAAASLPGTRVPALSETTPGAVTVRELAARAVTD